MNPFGYPLTAHLPPRKDGEDRLVDDNGLPIWRISYTDAEGERRLTLLPKPCRHWARMWAQGQGKLFGWTKIMVGRWHGGMSMQPSRWVTRTALRADRPDRRAE